MSQEKFFRQCNLDAMNDFIYSCKESKGEYWDWIVLTSANERQAESYRIQIEKRRKENWLPRRSKFIVIPDYKNQRIGSGGATLNVIRYICEEEGIDRFLNSKTLIIHSGGDSKRIPQYSACGKLFSPVPRILPSDNMSTLFDELLILASGLISRVGNGLMIFPGDTQMLFNSLQLDLMSCDAAGISMKAPVSEGVEHGVFLQSQNSTDHRNWDVAKFLHKLSEDELRSIGAVDEKNQVDIDTGCVWLGEKVVKELIKLIYEKNEFNLNLFEKYVNSNVCLNFYADFIYPLSEQGNITEYLNEQTENGISDELLDCRKIIWNHLHRYSMSLVKMMPAKYIHFGMTHELFCLYVYDIQKFSYLNWMKQVNMNTNNTKGTVLNSYISEKATIDDTTFIENSVIGNDVKVAARTIISNIEIEGKNVPSNVVLSGIILKNSRKVCRIYRIEDNPKETENARFLGSSIGKLMEYTGISKDKIWIDGDTSIWNAQIYPIKGTMFEAVDAALALERIIRGYGSDEEIQDWIDSEKCSLCSSFYDADVSALLRWQDKIKQKVHMSDFVRKLTSNKDAARCVDDLLRGINIDTIPDIVQDIVTMADKAVFPNNMRLYLAASDICRNHIDNEVDKMSEYEDKAYETVKKCIQRETLLRFSIDVEKHSIMKDNITVTLPVRINFCGSPSDAAPYCLEHGGTMLDGTLLLNGKKPIKVLVDKIAEGFSFKSVDQDIEVHYTNIEDIKSCGNPYDPFSMYKAAVMSTGLIKLENENQSMKEICANIGGGIRITTEVNIPKGSGLGTSSIVAAAIIKGLHLILEHDFTDEMIYAQVFLTEQLMNTGGGWQDQVGGFTKGVKYFTSNPGEYQKIDIETLNLSEKTMEELNSRFALIFSGQRRLARNILREEMNQCIRNNEESLLAIKKIQEYCAVMRLYLLKGNITEFGKYITKQFELVKSIDTCASNTYIEYIFDSIDDLVDGKSICGAGGGGFLQVILKENVTKEQLKERILSKFMDCGVEVWDCSFI